MRLWSLHPRHLDRAGLVAAWREALLAQAVLAGRTKGYTHHPQLRRFRAAADPLSAVGTYLRGLHEQSQHRGYSFNASKVLVLDAPGPHEGGHRLTVTEGQLQYEWEHLGQKLVHRSPADHEQWRSSTPTAHDLFRLIPGPPEDWEHIR